MKLQKGLSIRMEQIRKAYKCGTCKFFDYNKQECTYKGNELIPDALTTFDDLGNRICEYHVLRTTGEKTSGFYMYTPKERQKVYFVSDLHFSHFNILKHHPSRRKQCGVTEDEMLNDIKGAVEKHDKWLIELWNNTVTKKDIVYILGDFCLGNREQTEKILNKLNGKKHLIVGNHDKSLKGLERYFESVSQIKEVKFTNNQFKFVNENETFCVELCHFPLLTWNRRNHGTVHIHGHSHGSIDGVNSSMGDLRVDVGLDAKISNYHFVEVEELYKYFINIIEQLGCKTFEEYNNKLIEQGGIKG